MGLRGTLLWPLASVAGWADDNPLSAAGVVVAAGAVAALLARTVLGIGSDGSRGGVLAHGGGPVGAIADVALAQPAYVVVAVAGLLVFALYDG